MMRRCQITAVAFLALNESNITMDSASQVEDENLPID